VAACLTGGAPLGLALRSVLPEHHPGAASRDSARLASGVTALVPGLLAAAPSVSAAVSPTHELDGPFDGPPRASNAPPRDALPPLGQGGDHRRKGNATPVPGTRRPARRARGRAGDRQTADVVAEAVRDKGLACREAVSAERDVEASTPDEAAWTLVCSDARCRVRFVGDASVRVERLP